jgi:hypothetical protein
MLDVNGQSIGDGTLELVKFAETASAVNEITVTNSATTAAPEISATGDDTNIDLKLHQKVGNVVLDGIKFPSADGTADQFLKTDGSGNLSFDDPAFTLSYTKGTNTGDNSTTAFTINSGRSVNDVLVLVNGFLLTPTTDYTISGTTLTFTTAPASSAEIVFRYLPLNNSGVYTNDTATGDGSTTTLTIDSGRTVEDIIVTVNGVTLVPVTDYTISATTLTFATAPALSAEISVRYLRLT